MGLTRIGWDYPATFRLLGAKIDPQSNFQTNGRRETGIRANKSYQQGESKDRLYFLK